MTVYGSFLLPIPAHLLNAIFPTLPAVSVRYKMEFRKVSIEKIGLDFKIGEHINNWDELNRMIEDAAANNARGTGKPTFVDDDPKEVLERDNWKAAFDKY